MGSVLCSSRLIHSFILLCFPSLSPLPSPLSPTHKPSISHIHETTTLPRLKPLTHEANSPSPQTTTRSSRYDETAFRYLLQYIYQTIAFFFAFSARAFFHVEVYIFLSFKKSLSEKTFCNLLLIFFWVEERFAVGGTWVRRSGTLGILSFVSW